MTAIAAHSGEWPGLWDRSQETGVIEASIADGRRGVGALLVLRGPAGIGKSVLLAGAQRRAAELGMTVLRARAAPFEREFPYGIVRQLFERAVAGGEISADEMFSGAAGRARSILSDGPDTARSGDPSFASLHALYWLTANLAAFTPLLVCIDDIVWCDEASLRFLEFLTRRLQGMPVTVVLSYRTGGGGATERIEALAFDPLAKVLVPAPLGSVAVAQMVTGQLGEAAEPEFAAACQLATGGNPLLVIELLRALAAQGVHPRAAEVWRLRGIGSIAVGPAVSRRLAALGERAQELAKAIAVLGRTVRREDVAVMTGIDAGQLDELIVELTRAAIVGPDDQLSFAHPLVADAVRASLTSAQSASLRQAAIRALRVRGASAWELAPHLVAGPPRVHSDAAGLLREAARWAVDTGAAESAVTYLERAVVEHGDEGLAPLLLELGEAKLAAGLATATDDLGRAIGLASDARTRAMARAGLASALFNRGEYLRAMQQLEDAIVDIGNVDGELAQSMKAQLLAFAHYSDQQALSADWISDRLSQARSSVAKDPTPADRRLLCALSLEEVVGGGAAADAIALADRALAGGEILALEGPESVAFYSPIFALIWCDELQRAASILTLALAEARRRGSLLGFTQASAWRAFANVRLGRLLDAEADARAAFDSARQYLPGHVILAGSFLTQSLTAQGKLDEARAVLEELVYPDPPTSVAYLLLESRSIFHIASADPQSARHDLERYAELERASRHAVAWRKPLHNLLPHRLLKARVLIGAGDIEPARALIRTETPLAAALGTCRAIGMTRHVAGLLDRGDAQVQTLHHATVELAGSESRLQYADALCDYGAALRRANRRADARAPLSAALAIARDARANPIRDRAAQELKATGARVSRAHVSGFESLTASESRIASMAATGASNRDIAQTLFVTVKTVESHLGQVYRKLNLANRSQLSAALTDPTPR